MPQTIADRETSDRDRREIVLGVPDPRLRPYVRGYCGYFESSSAPTRRVEVPSGSVGLIVGLGPSVGISYPRHDSGSQSRVTSFVAGLHDSYAVAESHGRQQGLQVELAPIGAHMLLGVSMDTLANRVVELDQVLGRLAGELTEQLYESASWRARFGLLDTLFARLLAVASEPSPAVIWAWRRLSETDGRLGIDELAGELGASRQYLVTRFREEVGLAPKAIARILRFQRAIRLLEGGGDLRLTEVAYECGYYDQAHFNRDFRELTGRRPTEFLARRLPDGAGVVCR